MVGFWEWGFGRFFCRFLSDLSMLIKVGFYFGMFTQMWKSRRRVVRFLMVWEIKGWTEVAYFGYFSIEAYLT